MRLPSTQFSESDFFSECIYYHFELCIGALIVNVLSYGYVIIFRYVTEYYLEMCYICLIMQIGAAFFYVAFV